MLIPVSILLTGDGGIRLRVVVYLEENDDTDGTNAVVLFVMMDRRSNSRSMLVVAYDVFVFVMIVLIILLSFVGARPNTCEHNLNPL